MPRITATPTVVPTAIPRRNARDARTALGLVTKIIADRIWAPPSW